jgi:crossover junction endodeoxyribonuclease RuvC
VSTAISVGQARGVSLLAFAQANVPVNEYNPRTIKQSVTGYGGAEKSQIQEMVRSLLGMDELPKPDDAADALAIAICHLHSTETRRRMEDMT